MIGYAGGGNLFTSYEYGWTGVASFALRFSAVALGLESAAGCVPDVGCVSFS